MHPDYKNNDSSFKILSPTDPNHLLCPITADDKCLCCYSPTLYTFFFYLLGDCILSVEQVLNSYMNHITTLIQPLYFDYHYHNPFTLIANL